MGFDVVLRIIRKIRNATFELFGSAPFFRNVFSHFTHVLRYAVTQLMTPPSPSLSLPRYVFYE